MPNATETKVAKTRQTALLETPLGLIEIAVSERGLTHIDVVGDESATATLPENSDELLKRAREQLSEYFAGSRREFDLPLDLEVGDFERRVLEELSRVPYGTTVSYGELASAAGHPGAARAVGNVMRSNPVMIVAPCHRVIGADGSLRGYGGLGCGLDSKRWLIDFERASLS